MRDLPLGQSCKPLIPQHAHSPRSSFQMSLAANPLTSLISHSGTERKMKCHSLHQRVGFMPSDADDSSVLPPLGVTAQSEAEAELAAVLS